MKVAIVHDWFDKIAGSEKVVKEIKHCFPQADVFSLVDQLSSEAYQELGIDRPIQTSFIEKLPFKRQFRNYLPLMPIAIEQFDLRDYELVISSSHAVAKGCVTNSEQLHISYVHTPIRYAWDMYHEYVSSQRGVKSIFVQAALHYIRQWDRSSANRPDFYMANSNYVRKRIKKIYDRDATVIFPPVDTHLMRFNDQKDEFFLAAGRLVEYKRFDIVVEAMKYLPQQKLVVIGDGPEKKRLQKIAGSNVEFLGYQADEVLRDHMARAKAFVFGAIEDFGIMPVESQACGTPVIGIQRGGVAETVVDRQTGILFQEQTAKSVATAIQDFLALPRGFFDLFRIREHAKTFSRDVFRDRFTKFVEQVIQRPTPNHSVAKFPNLNSPEFLTANQTY